MSIYARRTDGMDWTIGAGANQYDGYLKVWAATPARNLQLYCLLYDRTQDRPPPRRGVRGRIEGLYQYQVLYRRYLYLVPCTVLYNMYRLYLARPTLLYSVRSTYNRYLVPYQVCTGIIHSSRNV